MFFLLWNEQGVPACSKHFPIRVIWNDFPTKGTRCSARNQVYYQNVSHLNSSRKCKWLALYTSPVLPVMSQSIWELRKPFSSWKLLSHFVFTSFTVSLLGDIYAFKLLQKLTRTHASSKIFLLTKKIKSSFIRRCAGDLKLRWSIGKHPDYKCHYLYHSVPMIALSKFLKAKLGLRESLER